MGVIGKIRSYSGLLIAIVGFGLAAFVLGDLFQYGPRRGVRHGMEIGKVNNTTISYPEFDERFNQHLESWKQQTGRSSPDDREMFRMRQQVWEELISELLLEEELEKVGIDVTADELFELVAGSEPHPFIVQSFTDPQTGEFDPQDVRNFIQNINMMETQIRNQWLMLEQYIKNERKEEKYHNIIKKSIFVPGIFAKLDYKNQNTSVDFRFIAERYHTIADEDVKISKGDIRNAYEENKHRFHQEHSRDLDYVVVPVFPTDEDRHEIKTTILELKEELKTVEDVERFINTVSDERFDNSYHSRGNLPDRIDSLMFNSPVGTFDGPYEEDNAFKVAMLNDIQFRPDSMRASHILISYAGSMADQQQQITLNREQAKEKADSLLNVVKRNPARFSQLATEFSDDPSAPFNQGDLEWFRDGDMVPEFNEAVVSGNVEDMVTVETQYGFHVIHITGHSPASKKVQVAKIIRKIEPSSQTYRQVFAEASEFATLAREKEDLESAANEKGYTFREATHVGKMDYVLPGVQNAREIIRWAYDENTGEGSTSQIFDLQDKFILAKINKIRKEGTPPLEDIRDNMEKIALENKKFDMIAKKLQEAVLQTKSLEKAAEKLELDLHTADDINFLSTTIPGFGREPKVIGKALALEKNTISNPIKGNNGAYIIEVVKETEPVVPDDLTAAQRQLLNNLTNRVANEPIKALKKNSDIKDNRTMFY